MNTGTLGEKLKFAAKLANVTNSPKAKVRALEANHKILQFHVSTAKTKSFFELLFTSAQKLGLAEAPLLPSKIVYFDASVSKRGAK